MPKAQEISWKKREIIEGWGEVLEMVFGYDMAIVFINL